MKLPKRLERTRNPRSASPLRLFTTVTGSGPVVVLVHGYLADQTYWNKLATALNSRHTVVSVDLLGFGHSPKPKNRDAYTFENQAELLRDTLQSLSLPPPFTLIGHSMGALVAATYGFMFPKDVTHLILSNMSIFIDPEETRAQLASTSALYEAMLYKPQGRVLWPIIKTTLPLLRLKHGELRNMTRHHSHASRQGALRSIEKTNAKRLLERLSVRTDLLVGLNDRAVYQKNIKLVALPKNVSLHYVPTGHHTPVQRVELLTRLL